MSCTDSDPKIVAEVSRGLGEAMHGVLAFPGSYAPPKRAGSWIWR